MSIYVVEKYIENPPQSDLRESDLVSVYTSFHGFYSLRCGHGHGHGQGYILNVQHYFILRWPGNLRRHSASQDYHIISLVCTASDP